MLRKALLGAGAAVLFSGACLALFVYVTSEANDRIDVIDVNERRVTAVIPTGKRPRNVLFSPDDRYEVEVQGEDYIMLRERDLHALAAKRIEASTGLYL